MRFWSQSAQQVYELNNDVMGDAIDEEGQDTIVWWTCIEVFSYACKVVQEQMRL